MNDATGLCRGCFRTLEEIGRWSQMSDRERAEVVAALPARRTAADASAAAERKS